jgi:hypothetical protein
MGERLKLWQVAEKAVRVFVVAELNPNIKEPRLKDPRHVSAN